MDIFWRKQEAAGASDSVRDTFWPGRTVDDVGWVIIESQSVTLSIRILHIGSAKVIDGFLFTP